MNVLIPLEVINGVAGTVQPLIFETGNNDYPYAIHGTAFLVGYQGRAFVITARHNLSLSGELDNPICIFPNDESQHVLPLRDMFFLPHKDVPDDYGDFAIIEIDRREIDSETSGASIIDCCKASKEWLENSDSSRFFVLGYPSDHSFVDYEKRVIGHGRMVLTGTYVLPREETLFLHELAIDHSKELTTFSGFSGAPVFSWTELGENRGQLALCGMVLRGTPSSGRMYFLDRAMLLGALKTRCRRDAS